MIDIQSVHIIHKNDDQIYNILYDLSLTIYDGEILGIAGESGSGKSVLAKYILGINDKALVVDSGELKIDDKTIISLDDYRSIRGTKVAMIFQDPVSSLNPAFTIGTQLIDTILLHNRSMTKREARELAIEYLKVVEIDLAVDRLDSYPHQLSGGMNQRVMIAIALSTNSKYLIADEPTTALDKIVEHQIIELLLKLNKERGLTIIFISHDLSILEHISNRIMILYAGEMMEILSRDDLENGRIYHPYTKALRDCIPHIVLDKLDIDVKMKTIKGQIEHNDSSKLNCCIFASRCDYSASKCREEKPKFNGRYSCFFPLKNLNGLEDTKDIKN